MTVSYFKSARKLLVEMIWKEIVQRLHLAGQVSGQTQLMWEKGELFRDLKTYCNISVPPYCHVSRILQPKHEKVFQFPNYIYWAICKLEVKRLCQCPFFSLYY
jgi:hypothetical protein